MKDFNDTAVGMPFVDTEFDFRGNHFHLQSFNDVEGKIHTVKLEAHIQSAALIYSIEKEAEHFSAELRRGQTLGELAEKYAACAGDSVYVVAERGRTTRLASNLWSAAFQILNAKYDGGSTMVPRTTVPSFLKVINGGMA